jgi:peptidyl-prolyl cis-trans isomerase SurA
MSVQFLGVLVAVLSVFFTTASWGKNSASRNESAVEYDGIVAVVNDEIITFRDLDQRVRLVLLSMGSDGTGNEKSRIRHEVLTEMIDERLKNQYLKKIAPGEALIAEQELNEAVNDILDGMAKQTNMPRAEFLKFLNSRGITTETIVSQIRVTLCWSEYIKARFGKNANISEAELGRLHASMREKFTQESYYVHRMFFPVSTSPGDESLVLAKVNNLLGILRRGAADFANLARQFSKSAESSKGGELGWVFRGQLSPEEEKTLQTMAITSYEMVKNSKGYFILFLQDRRESGRKTATNLKLVQLMVPFPAENPSPDVLNNVTIFANGLLKSSRNAKELIARAKESGVVAISEPSAVALESMNPKFRSVLASVSSNGFTKPIRMENGIFIICVLDRQTNSVPEPSRNDIKAHKINERLSVLADAEMQSLRKKAVVTMHQKH